MPFYLVPPASASCPGSTAAVPCRCCPGGISRSTRGRVYPSDMSDGEWAPVMAMSAVSWRQDAS